MSSDTPALTLLSLGAGVQSTAITILSANGDLPRLDGAIFADTGWEPRAVYEHLDRLEREILTPAGIPLHRVSSGNIRRDALDPAHRFASMPLFVRNPPEQVPIFDGTEACTADGCGWYVWRRAGGWDAAADGVVAIQTVAGETLYRPQPCETCDNEGQVPRVVGHRTVERKGMARRQCTSEYKLVPIKRKIRELLGFPHPRPVPRGLFVEQWIGISRDEWHRAKSSDVKYARNRFPLLDLDLTRDDCTALLEAHGFGNTPKSACIGCPFHGNRQWRQLRDQSPDEWQDAVDFDRAIRHGSARAIAEGKPLRGSMYLHSSLLPLDQAPIDPPAQDAQDVDGDLFADGPEEEIVGCSPFACRADEADLPWLDDEPEGPGR